MLSVCDRPATISYDTLMEHYFDGCEFLYYIKRKLDYKVKDQGALDDITIGPMKIIPKDSFFIRMSHLIKETIVAVFTKRYNESDEKIRNRVREAISWFGVVMYTHLADIEDVQLARYKITIKSPSDRPIYEIENADLSFLIKHFHSGMMYHDAITTCGQIYGYVMTSDYLCNYAKGLRRVMDLLSHAAIHIDDMHDIYRLIIEVYYPKDE